MPQLRKTKIEGNILQITGESIANSVIIFALTRISNDASSRHIVLPDPIEVPVLNNGYFSIDIWPNLRAQTNVQYQVSMRRENGSTVVLGRIRIPESKEPVSLTELLKENSLIQSFSDHVTSQARIVSKGVDDIEELIEETKGGLIGPAGPRGERGRQGIRGPVGPRGLGKKPYDLGPNLLKDTKDFSAMLTANARNSNDFGPWTKLEYNPKPAYTMTIAADRHIPPREAIIGYLPYENEIRSLKIDIDCTPDDVEDEDAVFGVVRFPYQTILQKAYAPNIPDGKILISVAIKVLSRTGNIEGKVKGEGGLVFTQENLGEWQYLHELRPLSSLNRLTFHPHFYKKGTISFLMALPYVGVSNNEDIAGYMPYMEF